jgi:hypothetical protein
MMMTHHLDALNLRLSNERGRLACAKTTAERELRAAWIAQIEKEIACEEDFVAKREMCDDELMAELLA